MVCYCYNYCLLLQYHHLHSIIWVPEVNYPVPLVLSLMAPSESSLHNLLLLCNRLWCCLCFCCCIILRHHRRCCWLCQWVLYELSYLTVALCTGRLRGFRFAPLPIATKQRANSNRSWSHGHINPKLNVKLRSV